MEQKQNLYLIGFMGAGKSTISAALIKDYGFSGAEMDEMIVEKAGMSIPDIFATKGEPAFRTMETGLLKDLASKSGLVVSCGGGAAMKEENVALMKESGSVILLQASCASILERVKDDHNRPLLEGRKTIEGIQDLMEARMPAYLAAADHVIQTDGKTPQAIASEIVETLK